MFSPSGSSDAIRQVGEVGRNGGERRRDPAPQVEGLAPRHLPQPASSASEPYSAFSVPTTVSLAKMPVSMPTVAGQLSSLMPIGASAGVIDLPTAASTERSVSWLPNEPSVPQLLKKLSTTTTATITRPARYRNSRSRSQVRNRMPRSVGRW